MIVIIIIALVIAAIIIKLSTNNKGSKRMEDLSGHLEQVLECARSVDSKRNNLHDSYNTFLQVNEEAIKGITDIRDKIVDVSRNSNYSLVGGTAGGIFGGILATIGTVASIPTGGASLLALGGLLTSSSAVLSLCSILKKDQVTKKLCKNAVKKLKKNQKCTEEFDEKYQSYFNVLEEFNSFFKTIKGNDVALALFAEFADEEEFDFLNDLKLKKWSRNKIRSILQEITKSDVTTLLSRTRTSEFLSNAESNIKNLAEKIQNKIIELKDYIARDPYLLRCFRDRMRDFLIQNLTNTHEPELRNILKSLKFGIPAAATIGTASCFNISTSLKLKEMSSATQTGLIALNTMFVVIGFVGLVSTLINLEHGSKSNESKSITDAIEDLKKCRKDITDEMGKNFDW